MILAILVSEGPAPETLQSLQNQTVRIDRVVLADRTFPDRRAGIRVAKAINCELDRLDLAEFDWLLRVDGDTILPPDWLERSMASGADVVGRGGYALLVKMSAFMAAGARFPVVEPEDALLNLKIQSLGFKAVPYVVKPEFLREPGRGTERSLFTFLQRGVWTWRLGYEPVHAVYNFIFAVRLRRNPRYLLGIFGYFFAAASRAEKWDEDVARFVFHKQVMSLRLNRAEQASNLD